MTECIEHSQKGVNRGYGNTRYQGKQVPIHRKVYCKAHGVGLSAIHGLEVRHTCDNTRCINPKHLVIGTHQDNQDDKVARGRQYRPHGVLNVNVVLTKEDVLYIRKHYKRGCKVFGSGALANQFGVNQSNISRVVTRKTWVHI